MKFERRKADLSEPKTIEEATERIMHAQLQIDFINEQLDNPYSNDLTSIVWEKKARHARECFRREINIIKRWVYVRNTELATNEKENQRKEREGRRRKHAESEGQSIRLKAERFAQRQARQLAAINTEGAEVADPNDPSQLLAHLWDVVKAIRARSGIELTEREWAIIDIVSDCKDGTTSAMNTILERRDDA